MRTYVPNTEAERRDMLSELGLADMGALYADVPEGLRLRRTLELGPGMSELELRRFMRALSDMNDTGKPLFRGAGAYRHYIPSAVRELASRSEFYTAYTPYQAEMSQGMLQGIFEFQSMICTLTGLDAANASVYDGATAAAEAMLMLRDAKRKKKMAVSAGLHPDVLAVMRTYAGSAGLELVEIPLGENGLTDREALKAGMADSAGFFAAQPNFFGCLEDMQALSDITHEAGGLFVSYVYPISLGLLKRPGDFGADIAVGDGQPLGLPLSFGGPYLGFMAATSKLMRNLPGRIAGETEDAEGNRAYVLTLQAREQHIRRAKAASNICSNQMLCALTATMYLSIMGKEGFCETAKQNLQKAHYLHEGMKHIKGVRPRFEQTPFFNEFTVETDADAAVLSAKLYNRGYIGGLRLSRFFPNDAHGMLWCATECNTREELDGVLCAIEEAVK